MQNIPLLEVPSDEDPNVSALLSESALSDWARDDEDAAWAHLQPEQ